MKNILSILLSILFILMLTGCNDPKFLKTITVNEPDLSQIEDGIYSGDYKLPLPAGYMIANSSADVKVTISNHAITKIELSGKLKDSMNPFLDQIIKGQKINIDTVTGASYSEKAIQKALEKALNKN